MIIAALRRWARVDTRYFVRREACAVTGFDRNARFAPTTIASGEVGALEHRGPAVRCDGYPSHSYAKGLLIKLSETLCRNRQGGYGSGWRRLRMFCGEPEMESKAYMTWCFLVPSKEQRNKVKRSVPTVPVTCHVLRVVHTVRLRTRLRPR